MHQNSDGRSRVWVSLVFSFWSGGVPHLNSLVYQINPALQRCSLWQDSQNVSDGPFLIGAVLDGQLEGELWLSAFHQLQTTLRLDVLDGATLGGKRGVSEIFNMRTQQGEAVIGKWRMRPVKDAAPLGAAVCLIHYLQILISIMSRETSGFLFAV